MSKTTVAVLDIGSSKINVVIALKGVESSFKVLGMGDAEYAGYYEGKFIDEDSLRNALGLALSNAINTSGCEIKELAVGIPAEFCFSSIQNVSIDFEKRRKVTQQDIYMLYDKANYLKKDRDMMLLKADTISYKIDHEIKVEDAVNLKANSLTAEISLIYVKSDIINLLNRCFEELQLEFVEYKSSAYVESRYIIVNENDILVDCGYLSTSVSMLKNKALSLLSSFSLGGGHITADLYEAFKLKFSTAETLKRNLKLDFKPKMTDMYEIEGVKYSAQDVNSVADYRVGQIARTVLKIIKNNNIENVNKILITGGGISYLKGIKDFLTNIFEKQVEIVAPPVVLLNKPHLSSTLGLLDDVIALKQNSKQNFLKKLLNKIGKE